MKISDFVLPLFAVFIVLVYAFGIITPKRAIRPNPTPSQLLHFQPVCEGSDPNLVRIAQAELCRHGIDVKIDGICKKQTALGICELLVKIQNGYKVRTIYEKR